MTRSPSAVAGLQKCLALEHEAVSTYAFLGARSAAVAGGGHASYESHRVVRDTLIAMLMTSGSPAPGPRSDYALPVATGTAQAKAAARSIETRCQAAYLALVGTSDGTDRQFAVAMLRQSALAGIGWGAGPSAFPGLPG